MQMSRNRRYRCPSCRLFAWVSKGAPASRDGRSVVSSECDTRGLSITWRTLVTRSLWKVLQGSLKKKLGWPTFLKLQFAVPCQWFCIVVIAALVCTAVIRVIYVCGVFLSLTHKRTDLHESLKLLRYCCISYDDRQNVVQFNDNVYSC